jgi:hypothetical protein
MPLEQPRSSCYRSAVDEQSLSRLRGSVLAQSEGPHLDSSLRALFWPIFANRRGRTFRLAGSAFWSGATRSGAPIAVFARAPDCCASNSASHGLNGRRPQGLSC